ncbi:putative 3-phytase a [Phaeomoniella chlamydospora]|uniref:3-phytase n=1 Tax=Phaeomoniella chlamydospora TaxID=158046 RepID=A0A0G2GVY6_PHACM|nr:putative 3-phytase a [Phaeomoniella chlamydospora]
MLGWGVITICQGVTASFAGLVVCRLFLGIFEAGFVPGAVYLISMYYKRLELQWRINIFFACSIMAGAFSGLLAYAIAYMDGIGGYAGWRWIFLIEGLFTVLVAVWAFWALPGWPEDAQFLTPAERDYNIRRLADDAGPSASNRWNKQTAKLVFGDVKIWLATVGYIGIVNTGYSTSYFTPTIISEFGSGYVGVRAQVMSIPIYIVATCFTLIAALLSDKLKHRYGFTMLGLLIATVGYAIMLNMGAVAVGPILMGWLNNNLGGHYKRGVGAAMQAGYQCDPTVSHFWGQYSPYFTVPSDIPAEVPDNCDITFAQILSRHGGRDPTASKTKSYNSTIVSLKQNVTSFTGKYSFLENYTYTLGADQLTTFGQQEMINSGIKFYKRYESLTKVSTPFIRSSSEDRVVESARNFTQGYHQARLANHHGSDSSYPYSITVISEDDGSNNTLNHGLCTAFEDGAYSDIGDDAQAIFADVFLPSITARLKSDLPGAQLTQTQTIYLMDLCAFNTVASSTGEISPFCDLFTLSEWHSYNYYETLGKYYSYSHGNPLGPTQGVGFTLELLSRLLSKPISSLTSTSHITASINLTLDTNPTTFPLGLPLYADFSHDNDITTILSALGLYNTSTTHGPLSNTTVSEAHTIGGYSSAWTVPFSARVYVEKMTCKNRPGGRKSSEEELVRILVNDRVVPLPNCDADKLGRCTLSNFVKSQGFALQGGKWDQCFD